MIAIQSNIPLTQQQLCNIAAFIKQSAGVWNNVAQVELFNAYDAIRSTPLYKHKVKKAVNDTIECYKAYEKNLEMQRACAERKKRNGRRCAQIEKILIKKGYCK